MRGQNIGAVTYHEARCERRDCPRHLFNWVEWGNDPGWEILQKIGLKIDNQLVFGF